MIEIHTQLNQQLAPLAKQLDVNQNQKPSKEQKKEIAQLEQLSGPDFDTRLPAGDGPRTSPQPEAVQERRILCKIPASRRPPRSMSLSSTQHYQILQKIAQTHNVTLDAKE